MRLYSPLKKRVKYKLVPVRLNTSFRTVLKCYQVFSDALLTDSEKAEACLWLLVKSKLFLKILKPDKKAALFNLIFKEFIDVSDKKSGGEKYFDFNQDAWAVYSSFMQCYHLDLLGADNNLHWWSFTALFNGLSDDTKIMQIISIRSRPLPKPTKYNAEERRQLIKLKQLYKLNLSEEERKKQFQDGLAKIAVALHTLAERP